MTSTASKTFNSWPGKGQQRLVTCEARLAFWVDNWHTRNAMLDHFVNHLENDGVYEAGHQLIVGAKSDHAQRLPELLGRRDVDCHEFQDSILCDDTGDHSSLGLGVVRYQWYPACSGGKHLPAGFVERSFRVDGDGFRRRDANRTFDI